VTARLVFFDLLIRVSRGSSVLERVAPKASALLEAEPDWEFLDFLFRAFFDRWLWTKFFLRDLGHCLRRKFLFFDFKFYV
jgi:hypothetical protein